jgi:branched-chain amino acid transport system substrate-binding protein
MVSGEHHVRMNMYIAQAHDGDFRIVENLGVIIHGSPRTV